LLFWWVLHVHDSICLWLVVLLYLLSFPLNRKLVPEKVHDYKTTKKLLLVNLRFKIYKNTLEKIKKENIEYYFCKSKSRRLCWILYPISSIRILIRRASICCVVSCGGRYVGTPGINNFWVSGLHFVFLSFRWRVRPRSSKKTQCQKKIQNIN
jgi:hypothetical protein